VLDAKDARAATRGRGDANVILRSARVVLPGGVRPADIHIEQGKIARIASRSIDAPLEREALAERHAERGDLVDVGDLVISPGLVDTHVHVNEPGRTEWEGFETATRAAAAGGVTTIVDMPLNSVPATTTVAALEAKRAAARGHSRVDVEFWGGVVPGNARELDALVDAGVRGFKCFLVPSGVDEFPPVGESDLRDAMPILARRHVPLLVHAEDPRILAMADGGLGIADRDSAIHPQSAIRNPHYARYLASRPPEAEVAAIRLMVHLSREFGAHVHIVHVASAEAADEIARAKAEGVRVTAETCPHYLTFGADDIADTATEFKCAPPIREARHRDALWAALRDGTLDLVATDHSPSPPSMKCADVLRAWGGIASLELSLAAVWTTLNAHVSTCNVARSAVSVARWMSEAPAALAGLTRKGRIAEGYAADFAIWDPDDEWIVDPSRLQQRHKLTPYAGRTLRARVHHTYVRGERVFSR
jgi:allantoinase